MSYEILKRAIETRQSLTGVYDDYVRFFSPHVLGRNVRGQLIVIGFQYGGGRPEGMLPPEGTWCVFAIDHLHRLEPNGDELVEGQLDNRPVGLMVEIDADSSVAEATSARSAPIGGV